SGENERPAIWVSVVGQGGVLVPVHAFTRYTDRIERAHPTPNGAEAEYLFRVPCSKTEPVRGLQAPPDPPYLDTPAWAVLSHLLAAAVLAGAVACCWTGRWWRGYLGGAALANATRGRATSIWLWRGLVVAGIMAVTLPHALAFREAGRACFDRSD